jgi:glycosyltransferase involved in cell wall biosynthesis
MTEIAVLLPCYNPPLSELQGTLDSLRKQSVPFKLYLVDDGSKTPLDYESLTAGMNVEIMRLPNNLGITGAMNAGLDELMKGEFRYIARIDCGDFCTPERFALQLSWMDAHADVGILGSAVEFRLFDAEGKRIGAKTNSFPLTHEDCVKRLYMNTAIIHPAMLIRRAVFEKLKGYSEEYPAAEDYELQWRAIASGFKLANLRETLLIKEETPGSISQRRRRKQIYNRMRIQWHNRNFSSPRSWAGIMKSLLTWLAPASVVNGIKYVIGGQR